MNFEISEIFCRDWQRGMGSADVWASNFVGDSLSFSIAWHPNNSIITYDLEVSFFSPELSPFMADDIMRNSLLSTAEYKLDKWWDEITQIKEALNPNMWGISAGVSVDEAYYALLALLYDTRSRYSSRYIAECMALDLNASIGAVRERIRKSRDKEFLTSPGKGIVGGGKITTRATNLIKRGKLL